MSEDINIEFKPNEYKYYYDILKIMAENETICVPIHAFPSISREDLRELFPRLIDFGIADIGTT